MSESPKDEAPKKIKKPLKKRQNNISKNELKRPQTPFFLFCSKKREEESKKENGKRLKAKELAKMWKELPNTKKKPFIDKYEKDKKEYDKKLEEFNKKEKEEEKTEEEKDNKKVKAKIKKTKHIKNIVKACNCGECDECLIKKKKKEEEDEEREDNMMAKKKAKKAVDDEDED